MAERWKGIVLWGTGLENMAHKTDPLQMKNASEGWLADIRGFGPWQTMTMLPEGAESRCWRSSGSTDGVPLVLTGRCSSVMDLAWHFIQQEWLPEWGSVLALSQWSGRGQLGREWISPGGNIYGALRIPLLSPSWANLISLLTGHALIRSFAQAGVEIKLKWPNDLVHENKKVGGILIEEKGNAIIAGIGINLNSAPPSGALRSDHAIAAASLSEFGCYFTPLSLWRQLMNHFRTILENTLLTLTPSAFTGELQADLAFLGEKIRVDEGHRRAYEATVAGISHNGGLILKTDEGLKAIRSGSICYIRA
ncbi:MAG: biotin--[acetyl-CoA-carboxylase] ligase [Proteobacteria bacterium]|nr:biotin--[acetyl-CoA-carboxylase] ligase [Pseudomonadota bacterium]